MIGAFIICGLAVCWLFKHKKQDQLSGVGKLNFIILCSKAQQMGVPLYVKFEDLTKEQKQSVKRLASEYGYKQGSASANKGVSIERAFYNFLQSKYKSIRRVAGIGIINRIPTGSSYPVYDEEGNVIASYYNFIERTPDKELYKQALTAIDESTGDPKDFAYWQTVKFIADGGRFVWKDKTSGGKDNKRVLLYGVESLVFGKGSKHPLEYKKRKGMLGSPEKNAVYPEQFAEMLVQELPAGVDDYYLREGVIEALRNINSKSEAVAEIMAVWGRDYEFEQAAQDYEYNKGYEQYARENNLI